MSLTMHIYSKKDDTSEGWDISEIVHDIEYTTSILGQPGKLTFVLEKDMYNSGLQIGVGSLVKFWHSDDDLEKEKPVFMGNVFTIGTDRSEAYRIVAYDSLRYLQNHNSKIISEDDMLRLEDVFEQICSDYAKNKDGKSKLDYSYLKPNASDYWLVTNSYIPSENFIDISEYEILRKCMDFASRNNYTYINPSLFKDFSESNDVNIGQYYYIRDDFGTLTLHEVLCDFLFDENGKKKNEFLVIGNESLLTNYQYEVDIDKDTYNEFYFMYNKIKNNANEATETNKQVEEKQSYFVIQAGGKIEKTNTELDGQTIGEATIPKWGKLRKFVTLNKTGGAFELEDYAKNLIELFNQPTRSMKLSALGYDGLYAGGSFIFKLDKLKINYPVYVISATHHYNGDSHTMELEVNVNPKMEMFV